MRLFVWLGGTVFVIALAITGWTFAMVFARDLPYRGWGPVAFDLVLFSCFALHHTLFAREWAKSWIARAVPPELVRSVYVWIASLLLIAVDVNWIPIGGSLYTVAWPAAALCAAVQVTGVWLTVRGAQAIDPLELAGIRGAGTATALQVGGPYRLVRHPLYFGWTLIVFATAHMTGDRLAFAVISTGYLALAIPFEERSLVRLFGAQYERYRHRVRWRMIPFVY